MDNGIYDKKEKKDFIDHHYFKPLVFSPIKEEFQSTPYLVLFGENKEVIDTIVNITLFLVLVLLLILLFFSNHTKCLKKMNLKKILKK
jgi:hypothetical protein|tara:strand:+ start:212 stop:475 length:264 start_codon:yes stop_codon:yes gene_type:complete